jgi:heme A synthase
MDLVHGVVASHGGTLRWQAHRSPHLVGLFCPFSRSLLTRLVCAGIAFGVPLAYFAARGYVDRALGIRLGMLFCLGGAQGAVGWWMVKSGLQRDKIKVEEAEAWQLNTQFAAVSPYRLTAHLGSALTIYALLLWTGLGLLDRRRLGCASSAAAEQVLCVCVCECLCVCVCV